jgi:predicted ester cyclase
LLDEVLSPDFIGHDLSDNFPRGRVETFRLMVDAAFRDLEAALQDIVAEDDRVAARVRLRGQHRGDLLEFNQPTA